MTVCSALSTECDIHITDPRHMAQGTSSETGQKEWKSRRMGEGHCLTAAVVTSTRTYYLAKDGLGP